MASTDSNLWPYPLGTCKSCRNITLANLVDDLNRPDNDWRWLAMSYWEIRSKSRTCPLCAIIIQPVKNLSSLAEVSTVYLYIRSGETFSPNSTPRLDNVMEVRVNDIQGEWSSQNYSRARFRVYADTGSFASKWLSNSPLASKESPETKRQIADWIRDCDSNHDECNKGISGEIIGGEAILPTRLVYVGPMLGPHLSITKGKLGRYITLSHCWGGETPYKTTKSNVKDYETGLPLENFPRTFRDAIDFTRDLGISFIWIDSLCIIQDDHKDWVEQSKQMGSIYERAYMTIAATSGVNSSSGLFHDGRPVYVKFPCSPNPLETGYMYFANVSEKPQPENDIELAPLNQRGWVLQERVLSRRILHFASTQVYWECRKHFLCQSKEFIQDMGGLHQWSQLNQMLNTWECTSFAVAEYDLLSDSIPMNVPHPLNVPEHITVSRQGKSNPIWDSQHFIFHALWARLIRYFSSRDLTFTSDRENALEGIKERLQTRMGFDYISGHWVDSNFCFI
ncbi:heterokaryon incompatibility protein-domain-containing protein, partial [Hyaloscypha finlandica]